jgi:hypothetical protein
MAKIFLIIHLEAKSLLKLNNLNSKIYEKLTFFGSDFIISVMWNIEITGILLAYYLASVANCLNLNIQ